MSKEEIKKLKLPMFIEINPTLGSGSALIRGRLEVKIIKKIGGIEREGENNLVIYRPEVREIRKVLRTTTCYVFSV